MKTQQFQVRQGDVLIQQVASLPPGCVELAPDSHRLVLAHGEVTGHAHAIYDHIRPVISEGAAEEIADAAIARAKARLYQAPSGARYLQVDEAVTLKHEEHTAHVIPAGVYLLPVQVEYTPAELRRVLD